MQANINFTKFVNFITSKSRMKPKTFENRKRKHRGEAELRTTCNTNLTKIKREFFFK